MLTYSLSFSQSGTVLHKIDVTRDNIQEILEFIDKKTYGRLDFYEFNNSANESIGFLYPSDETFGSLSRILLKEGESIYISNRGEVYPATR